MAYPSPVSVAPSNNFDHFGASKVFMRPAESPIIATASPQYGVASDYFSAKSRKRQRSDSTRQPTRYNFSTTPEWAHKATPNDEMFGSGCANGSSLVNERYRLAGGYDTPSIRAATDVVHNDRWEDTTCRGRLTDHDAVATAGESQLADAAFQFGPLARERNGAARLASLEGDSSPTSWTNFAFGLVGKVFSFGGNVIRGFYAGNGQGYELNNQGLPRASSKDSCFPSGLSTPIPGAWQDEEFLGDFEQDNPTPTTERPLNKRRQTDKDAWVLVGTPDLDKSTAASRSLKRPSLNPSGGASRQNGFVSSTSRPSTSRTSSRRSFAPVQRRQHSYITTHGSPAASPYHQSPNPNIRAALPVDGARSPQRASHAPARQSPTGLARRQSLTTGLSSNNGNNSCFPAAGPATTPTTRTTPPSMATMVSPEAERFAKRQARQDRAADRAMATMGRKMEEMIRQAQEALGTKVEIEGDLGGDFEDDDGGWA